MATEPTLEPDLDCNLETSALFETVRLPGFDDSSLNGRLRQGLRLDGKACSSASLASRGAQEAM